MDRSATANPHAACRSNRTREKVWGILCWTISPLLGWVIIADRVGAGGPLLNSGSVGEAVVGIAGSGAASSWVRIPAAS